MYFYSLSLVTIALLGGVTHDFEQFISGFIWTAIQKDDLLPIEACFNDTKDADAIFKKVYQDFEH